MKKRLLSLLLTIIAIFTFNINVFAGPADGGIIPRASVITNPDTEINLPIMKEVCYEKKVVIIIVDYHCDIHI